MGFDIFLFVYIGFPIAMIVLGKLGIVGTIVKKLDSMWVFVKGFTLYNLISFFFIVGLWVYILLPLPQLLKGNILIEYSTNLSGHFLSWVGLMAVVTYYGYFRIIKGLYVGALVYSVHELVWIFAAGIVNNAEVLVWEHYWLAIAVMTMLVAGYFLVYRSLPIQKEIMLVVVIAVFDLLWSIAGLHATVENWLPVAQTVYWSSGMVNAIEVLSWLLPCLVIILV